MIQINHNIKTETTGIAEHWIATSFSTYALPTHYYRHLFMLYIALKSHLFYIEVMIIFLHNLYQDNGCPKYLIAMFAGIRFLSSVNHLMFFPYG